MGKGCREGCVEPVEVASAGAGHTESALVGSAGADFSNYWN